MTRLYTQLPIECTIKEFNRIFVQSTVVKSTTTVLCHVAPLNATETCIVVVAKEASEYPALLVAWADFTGRWETSGPTVIRIPIIVRLWENCVVQGIKIIATLTKADRTVAVFAQLDDIQAEQYNLHAQVLSRYADSEHHVLYTVGETQDDSGKIAFVTNAIPPSSKFTLKVFPMLLHKVVARLSTIPYYRHKNREMPVWTRVFTGLGRQKVYIRASVFGIFTKAIATLRAHVIRPESFTGTTHVTTRVLRNLVLGNAQIKTTLLSDRHVTVQITTRIVDPDISWTLQLSTRIVEPDVAHQSHMYIDTTGREMSKMFTLSVYTALPNIKMVQNIISDVYNKFTKRIKHLRVSSASYVNRRKELLVSMVKNAMHKQLLASMSKSTRQTYVQVGTGIQRGITRDIEGVPLGLYEERYLQMGTVLPYNIYRRFYVKAYASGIDATVALFCAPIGVQKHETQLRAALQRMAGLRLVQWYLHNTNIANEGLANEIIFDLGRLDPIGPLPPVPDESWGGGYVDYPFKGMGYKSTEAADGYLSPAAKEWVKNAKMFWGTETEIFEDE